MILVPQIKGTLDVYNVVGNIENFLFSCKNFATFSGMDLLTKLIAGEDAGINGMYFEYENITSELTEDNEQVTKESISGGDEDPEKGVEYYMDLVAPKDYLRLPAYVKVPPTASGDRYKSNRVVFHASGDAEQGVNGLEYSSSARSVVYGMALVHLGDIPAEDIVYARTYFSPDKRIEKTANSQIGIDWTTTIYHPNDRA